MSMSKRLGLKAATASWFATCMLSSLFSCCSIAYCQTDPKEALTKELLTKDKAEDLSNETARFQNLETSVAQIETQVKLSKYKNLLEEISKLELELASVVYVDQKDAEQSEPLLFQKEHRLEKLKAEATATREQLDKLGVPHTKEQLAKNEAESKLWHETMEKVNGLVKEQKWREVEQLANEMASRFGSEDALIQAMLWTSINGQRKSQGLAPLIREMKAPDTKTPIITMYSLQDVLPKADKEVPVFVDVLTQCISAAIEQGGTEESKSKIIYDTENKRLMVVASKPQQQLVNAILKRVNKTKNAELQKTTTSTERQSAETQLQSLLKLYPSADANNDGWLTQQEVRELFPDADANGDGKVTPVEIRNYLAKQKN